MYYNTTQYKAKYDYYVSICNNLDLMEKYDLQAHGGINYCYSSLEDKSPDGLDWAFVVVLSAILLVLIGATTLDVYLREIDDEEHFKRGVSDYCKKLKVSSLNSKLNNYSLLFQHFRSVLL